MIDGTLGHRGGGGDLVHGGCSEALPAKQILGRDEDCPARRRAPFRLGCHPASLEQIRIEWNRFVA